MSTQQTPILLIVLILTFIVHSSKNVFQERDFDTNILWYVPLESHASAHVMFFERPEEWASTSFVFQYPVEYIAALTSIFILRPFHFVWMEFNW